MIGNISVIRPATFLRLCAAVMIVAASPTGGLQAIQSESQTDPELITGTLENGMRYYIKPNTAPNNRAMLWLAVKAGSIHEDDDQLGYAHFVEHMAFNGTKTFPGNSLIDLIEHAGMNFGADLNAYTSLDETVYQLTIPTDDSVVFHKGLQILQDWAGGGITFEPDEVANERGVVLGEWRGRLLDTLSQRLQDEALRRIFGNDSKYNRRMSIGDPDLLRKADSVTLERYYKDWYTPNRMAIIAVGDFDVRDMEREIKKRFGSIEKASNPRPWREVEFERQDTTMVHIVKGNIAPSIVAEWKPLFDVDANVDSSVKYSILEQIVFSHLGDHFTRMAALERRPLALATIRRVDGGFMRLQSVRYQLSVIAAPDSLEFSFATVLSELVNLQKNGIGADQMIDLKARVLKNAERSADVSAAFPSRTIATSYVNHFMTDRGALLSARQRLDLTRSLLSAISGDDIKKFAGSWRNEVERVVTVNLPQFAAAHPPTHARILSLMDSVGSLTSDELSLGSSELLNNNSMAHAATKSSVESGSRTPAGKGSIVNTTFDASSGVTLLELSNSARVLHKETHSNPDGFVLLATSPGGHSLLADSIFYTAGRYAGMMLTGVGGIGNKTNEELKSYLRNLGVDQFSVRLNAFSEEFITSGSPHKLESIFQLLHQQFTEPVLNPVEVQEWARAGIMNSFYISPEDNAVFQVTRHKRLVPPSLASIPFADHNQALHVFKDRFGDASDFTFIVVGAVSVAQIMPFVESYIASLPSTNRAMREKPHTFSRSSMSKQRTVGRDENPRLLPEQGVGSISFTNPFPDSTVESLMERRRLSTLSWIVSRRLRNKLREEMAVTYVVSAPVGLVRIPRLIYSMNIQVTTPPELIDTSMLEIHKTLDEMRTEGPTDEELEMAAISLRRSAENAVQSNNWWINRLKEYDMYDIPLKEFMAIHDTKFSKEEIRQAAIKYMPKNVFAQSISIPPKAAIQKKKINKE